MHILKNNIIKLTKAYLQKWVICHKLLAYSYLVFLQLFPCPTKDPACLSLPIYKVQTLIRHSFPY